MSFAPLPLLPAHLTRQDSRTLTTAGGHRRHPRSAVSTGNKVWRVVTTEGGEAENNDEEDGPSTAIQRGNGVQVPLEKLLKPPGAPSSKPLSEWKASPPTGLTLEELRRRASGQQDEESKGEEAHTFRQEESSPPHTPARGHVVFAPHVKIASGPPRAHAPAATIATASAEAETVAHDFVTVTISTAPSSNQPPPSSKPKAFCRPTSATGRLRHVASKLRPSTAPDSPGQDNASSASPAISHAQPKEAKSRPKTETNSPPQHGNASQSQSRPPITYCPASPDEPGFPDGYIVGRLHPDGPFSSSSNRTPSTPSAASTPQALATEDSIFRPARPQELPNVQGRFYEGTLILVRGKEDEAADAEGAPQPKQEEVTEDGVQKGSASASKVGFAGRVKQTVGRIKLMGDATDTSAEAQQPPTPQRRVGPAAAAAKGKAAARVNLPSKPRARQEGQRQLRRRASTGAAPSKRKATPPAPPPIPTRSSSAELARNAAAAAEPADLSTTTRVSSLKGGSITGGDFAPRGECSSGHHDDEGDSPATNELDTLPIILWSGWASCSSSASSGCSTPSSSSGSSTSHVAPQAPPSPSRRSAFDQSRGQQQQQDAAGKAMGKGSFSRETGREARGGEFGVAQPASSNLLPGLGGAVRLAVKKVAGGRRPVTPAPAAVVPPPPSLQHVAEKRGGEVDEDQGGGGRAALDLPARDDISAAVEPSPAHKLITPKSSLARASREPARQRAQQQHRREVRIVVWPRATPNSKAGPRSKSRASLGVAAQQGEECELEGHVERERLDSRPAGEDDEVAKSNGAVVFGSELRSILL